MNATWQNELDLLGDQFIVHDVIHRFSFTDHVSFIPIN